MGPTSRTGTHKPHDYENGTARLRVYLDIVDCGEFTMCPRVLSDCIPLDGVYDRRMVNFVTAGFFVRVSANMGND